MMTSGEFNSSNSVSAPPTLSGTRRGFEEVDDGSSFKSCSTKRQRTDDRIPVYSYSDEEEEVAKALVMLSISDGGYCCSSFVINPESQSQSQSAVASTKSAPSTPANKEEEKGHNNKINPPIILRLKLPPKTAQQDKPYKCSECNMTFSSYQELGGHKTSHRIKPATASTVVTEFNSISNPNPSGRLYECSICHKTFKTGQALGGHMRKHYDPVKTAGLSLSDGGRPTKSEVTYNTNIGGRPCIDLNLPPSPEEQVQTPVLLPLFQ